MLTIVIAFFAISMIMECVMYLKYNYNIVWRVDGTILSRVLHYLGFIGIAVGFILPSTTVEEDEIEEYVNKEQADAEIMVISPENQKPRSNKNKPRKSVLDDNDFVFSLPREHPVIQKS